MTALRTTGIIVAVIVGITVMFWFVTMCIHEFSDTNPADILAPPGSYTQNHNGNYIPLGGTQ